MCRSAFTRGVGWRNKMRGKGKKFMSDITCKMVNDSCVEGIVKCLEVSLGLGTSVDCSKLIRHLLTTPCFTISDSNKVIAIVRIYEDQHFYWFITTWLEHYEKMVREKIMCEAEKAVLNASTIKNPNKKIWWVGC